MALVKCKECHSEISSKATVCPRCGAKPRRTSGCAWLVLFLLLGAFIFPLLIAGFSGAMNRASGHVSRSSEPQASPIPKPEHLDSRRRAYVDGAMVVSAKRAVKAALRDPDSAKFRDVSYGESEDTGPAVFGHVNSRNALGGYTGFVKFVSNGKTTLIEGRDQGTAEAWRALYSAAITERTLANLPQNSQTLPVKMDVTKLVGKTVNQVNTLLGKPSSQEKIREGNKLIYEQKEVEVVFRASKANLITVSNLEHVPFGPAAISVLGLPKSQPSFASEHVLKWSNIQGISEISIFRGQKGCDYAYIIVSSKK